MLSFFRKKKATVSVKEAAAQDKLANRIVSVCIRWQQRWADFMQRRTERLSDNGKRIVLIMFCLMAGSLSIYPVANSFTEPRFARFHILQLSPSPNSGKAGDENTRVDIGISKSDYQRLERFRHYMDSLAASTAGRRTYDGILIHRSGLMDSLYLIEKLYQLQNKK